MGATTTVPREQRRGDILRTTGGTIVLLGVLGIAAWAVMAAFAVSYGSVSAETLAGQIAVEGIEDPRAAPDVWTAMDEHGRVVFEGTREQLAEITAEGRAAYQAELREDWLRPPLAATTLGAVLFAIGHVNGRTTGARP